MVSAVQWQSVLVNLDNFVMFLKSWKTDIKHFGHLLTLSSDNSATDKFKKRQYVFNTIEYLGHVIHLGPLAEL